MLVRRLISAVIRKQKRETFASTAPRETSHKSSKSPARLKPSGILALLGRGLVGGLNPLASRLLLRAFSLEKHSAEVAANRINVSIQETAGDTPAARSERTNVRSMGPKEMPADRETASGHDAGPASTDECETASSSRPAATDGEWAMEDEQQQRESETVETETGEQQFDKGAGQAQARLREAYDGARKRHESVWLDYADKAVHIYLYKGGGQPRDALAAFDLDGTLIKPKSNKRIPRSATDWQLFSVWTKATLQRVLRANAARFVIFTNQNGVGLNIVPLGEVQQRIELVVRELDVPCTVFMATEKDEFRKPRLGMFKLFMECFNDSARLNLADSFYCGDAIGYPSHSDADIKFAQQLDLPFLTPEKFLRGVKPKLVGE